MTQIKAIFYFEMSIANTLLSQRCIIFSKLNLKCHFTRLNISQLSVYELFQHHNKTEHTENIQRTSDLQDITSIIIVGP